MNKDNTDNKSENSINAINNVHDVGYRAILSNKKTFVELLKTFVKQEWVSHVDESDLVRIDRSYVLQDFSEKESDIVYKMRIRDSEVIFYCLLEMQSSVDFMMPYRLLLYMTEIWRDVVKNTEKKLVERKEYRLPAIIPMVLYNGRENWTACRSFKEMLNGHELFSDSVVDFSYALFDVNRYSEKELSGISNLISTVFLLDQDINSQELLRRIQAQLELLKRLAPQEKEVFFNWVAKIITRDASQRFAEEVSRLLGENQEVEVMVYNLETAMKEEFSRWKQEGIQEGIKEGIQEGIKEGIREGADKAKRDIAREMLKKGMDINVVVEITALSEAEVKSILSEISN